MDFISKQKIKNLLKVRQIYPSKRLGQNFLIDKLAIKKFLKAVNLKSGDIVLEIGPGIGNLTGELAKKVRKVIAIEKDPKMINILKDTTKEFKNIKIIQGDILKTNLKSKILNLKSYKVVANLPYYITAPAIRKFLESENHPEEMVLIIQKEVAQRICAKPPNMNLLAVSVQFYAKPEIICYVSKKSFWPQPKVDAAIIKITPHKTVPHQCLRYGTGLHEQFFEIVRSGFSQPRKQIVNNLTKMLKFNKEQVNLWLLENNIQPQQRAETLNIKDWLNLAKTLNKYER